jgi:hypothetical protein
VSEIRFPVACLPCLACLRLCRRYVASFLMPGSARPQPGIGHGKAGAGSAERGEGRLGSGNVPRVQERLRQRPDAGSGACLGVFGGSDAGSPARDAVPPAQDFHSLVRWCRLLHKIFVFLHGTDAPWLRKPDRRSGRRLSGTGEPFSCARFSFSCAGETRSCAGVRAGAPDGRCLAQDFHSPAREWRSPDRDGNPLNPWQSTLFNSEGCLE